jgi:23S rRNA (cytosine1962-C5)-methyltransferase
LPEPNLQRRPTVRVTRKGAARLDSGHPWVFSSDIADPGGASPGEVVRVTDQAGRALGTAHWSSTSKISLRLLDASAVPIDRTFFLRRLDAAAALRRRVVRESTAWRLVHGEADQLPGLVIDNYDGHLAIQFLSQGMDRASALITECLIELMSPKAIIARNDAPTRRHESLPQQIATLHGQVDGPVEVRMNGLVFRADLVAGQKTGVFLDQRENYVAAAARSRGQALDCFTSSGGYALHMAGNCDSVEAVDSSRHALENARENAAANGIAKVTFREADVFELLAGYWTARRRFDTIVVDPPAFAKSKSAVEGALCGYYDINYRALRLLAPGGVLVSCCCSQNVAEAALLETIARAALEANRNLRILERRTQASDHPILLTVPETQYLKCLILEAV